MEGSTLVLLPDLGGLDSLSQAPRSSGQEEEGTCSLEKTCKEGGPRLSKHNHPTT